MCTEVRTHLQGSNMFFGRVAVYIEIFPAITGESVSLAVKANQTALVDGPPALGWLVVVLVYLGQAVKEIKFLVEYIGMRERRLH